MSEEIESTLEENEDPGTGEGTETPSEPGTGDTPTTTSSTSVINQAVESVIALINELTLFANITRGALGTCNTLACEIGPSGAEEVYLDKNQYIVLDLTINGKHDNLQTLSDAMNAIHESLTMKKSYPSESKWKIVDITTLTEPQVIGREDNNAWMMASALNVKVYTNL